jgi:hypothetical protein
MKTTSNFRKALNQVLAVARPRARRALIAGGTVASAIVVMLIGGSLSQTPAPAIAQSAATPPTEEELAIHSFLHPMTLEEARLADPEFAREEAIASYSFLHPDIVSQERLKDPVVAEQLRETSIFILDPHAVEAELMKDAGFRKQRDEAFRPSASPITQ